MARSAGPNASARPGGGPRRLLRTLHLWVGLSVGAIFALLALSGSVLALQGPLLRALHPQLMEHDLPTPPQQAAVLARIAREWAPRGLHSADLPDEDLHAWQLYFDGGVRRYLDPARGELLLTRTPRNDPLLALREWHTRLLAGRAGEILLGVLGWISLGLLLSGLVLWWPGRGRLLAHLKPHAQPPVRRWLSWHRSAGAFGLPLLVLATLTGTLMTYHTGTRQVLQALFFDVAEPAAPAAIAPQAQPVDWAAVLAAARQALPGSTLGRISMSGGDDGRVTFRARMPGEWNPTGRSMIWLDPYRARVLGTRDASAADTGARMNDAIYPLHAGSLGPAWRSLVIACGLLPAFFLATGLLFWRARRRRHA